MPISGSAPNKNFTREVNAYSGSDAWQQLDAAGRKILSVDQDDEANDQATAINACLFKDGGNFAADMDINGNKFTNVGNAAARASFAAAGQVQDSSLQWAGTSSGTDTITASVTPAITAYAAGQCFRFIAGGTNTGAATLNLNSVGAIDIKKGPAGTTALAAGDITAGGIYTVAYNGTTGDFELLNPAIPQVNGLEIGHASDTTITRASAGDIAVEGNTVYRTGGTDVAITDGGTGASTASAAFAALKQAATEDATGVVELATVAEAEAGTDTARAVTPAGVLASINANAGLALLNSGTVSAAATLDIVLTSYTGYRALKFVLSSFVPATDDQELWMRFSTNGGSSYDATGYSYALSGIDDSGTTRNEASGSDNHILIAGDTAGATVGVSNTANQGGADVEITLHNQTAARFGRVRFSSGYFSPAGRTVVQNGAGSREAAQDTDAVRFLFSSGNIASGTWAVYGYA